MSFTFTVYKGNSHVMFHQFYGSIWFCTENGFSFKTDSNDVLYLIRKKHLQNTEEDPVVPMTAPVRVSRGVPVLGKFPDCFKCHVEFSEFTDNLFTFKHDFAIEASTIILDHSRTPDTLLPGLYSSSLKFVARREFWADPAVHNQSIYRRCDNVCVELLMTLEKWLGPLPETIKKEPAPEREFPKSISALIKDFRLTFNV